MALPRLTIDGHWFREPSGRRVLLRGVNLGGDCKVPCPNGGTQNPSDFSDHRDVSFIGRPFPLAEADEHFGRLRHWGFNCLRLLTTWEAVEHAGPGQYDGAYLDYFAEIARRAGDFGLYVFVDFHQDVWARMSGGDGAPGWTFEAAGLDFTKFHGAGAAHVMQHKYDYARGGRQEDRYPTMTWSQNYSQPANAIMWTLFFAGRDFAPDAHVGGVNIQDYLQSHYLGAMREVAKRLAGVDHVLGFDTLNEPGTGWIGKALSYRHTARTPENPAPVRPGPAWSPLDGLLVARGVTRRIPQLAFDLAQMAVVPVAENDVNTAHVSIWRAGRECPFEKAGAYRMRGDEVLSTNEDFFRKRGTHKVELEADYMAPFFRKVAETVRAVDDDWLVFAELDPFTGFQGHGFPKGTPERTVNASHWYDIVTLSTKTFMYPVAFNPFSGKSIEGPEAIRDSYVKQLSRIKEASASLGGAPTLIGEFGIPYDLDEAAAYKAWAAGDRSADPWDKHVIALDLMYDAMDALLLHTAQWNYTASNLNDQATGDQWNQEDLSIFSRDQQSDPKNPDSGGRAVAGFCRPFLRACQGVPLSMHFERASGAFELVYDADPAVPGATEIYVPHLHYPTGFAVNAGEGATIVDAGDQRVLVTAAAKGRRVIRISRR